MKPHLIGSYEGAVKTDGWYKEENDAVREAIDNLFENCSFAVVTFKDGKKQIRSPANLNGGYCECCSDSREEIVKHEFYKVEL